MRNALTASLFLMLTSGAFATAGEHGCGSCETCPICRSKVIFRIEEQEEKYTVPVRVENHAVVKVDVADKEVPCTRLVPVCVVDPATGCQKTEYKEETYMKKVKTTVLDVTPPCEEFTCKTEVKTRKCTKVYMQILPLDCCPTCGVK